MLRVVSPKANYENEPINYGDESNNDGLGYNGHVSGKWLKSWKVSSFSNKTDGAILQSWFDFEVVLKFLDNSSFFFRDPQLTTVLLLICDSYMSWSTKFVSVKLCVGFYFFDSVSSLLIFIFLLNTMHGVFDFKTS